MPASPTSSQPIGKSNGHGDGATSGRRRSSGTFTFADDYYAEDGVAVSIAGVTFKVARDKLARNSPIFALMFSKIDGETSPRNGRPKGSLHNPLTLSHSEMELAAFPDYLWLVHEVSNPLTVEEFHTRPRGERLLRLLNMVLLAIKFDSDALLPWATQHCLRILSQAAVPLNGKTVDLLVAVMTAFRAGGSARAAFEGAIRGYLQARFPSWETEMLRLIDIVALALACEAKDLTGLAASAYHALLLLPRSAWIDDKRLLQPHRVKLLCGMATLAERWDATRQRYHESLSVGPSAAAAFDAAAGGSSSYDLRAKIKAVIAVLEDPKDLDCNKAAAQQLMSLLQRELKSVEETPEVYFNVSRWHFSA